jgi:oligosaccharide translocation protein RFT1
MSAGDSSTFFKRLAGTLLWSLLLKVFTFSLTTVFTRLVAPDVRGVTFYLDLYVDFVGFLAKEAVRSAVLRSAIRTANLNTQPGRRRCLMDVIFLFNAAIWSVVCAAVMLVCNEACAWLVGDRYLLPSLVGVLSRLDVPMKPSSVALTVIFFVAGLLLQAAAEPKVCLLQAIMQYRTKVSAESSALSCRLVVLLAAAVGAPSILQSRPLLVASAAHLAYGVAYFTVFERSWSSAARRAKTTKCGDEGDVLVGVLTALHVEGELDGRMGGLSFVTLPLMVQQARRLGATWWQFFTESTMRVLLTEGEKFALAALGTLSEQGIFDAVTNLGGVVARLVFRLWEETCFARWSSIMSGSSEVSKNTEGATSPASSRLVRWEACYGLLESILAVAVQVSMAFAVFGPPLSQPLLKLLYSDRWGSAESAAVLSRLCVALPLMAVNGLLEAFVRGTSSTDGLRRAKLVMFVTSALYVSSCFALLSGTDRGVVGLMEASLITTAVRLFLSSWLIQKEHADLSRAEKSPDHRGWSPVWRAFTWLPSRFWAGAAGLGAVSWSVLEFQLGALSDVPLVLLLKLMGLVMLYVVIAAVCDGPTRTLSNAFRRVLRRGK